MPSDRFGTYVCMIEGPDAGGPDRDEIAQELKSILGPSFDARRFHHTETLSYLLSLFKPDSAGAPHNPGGSVGSPQEMRDPARKALVDFLRNATGRPDFHGDLFSPDELQTLADLYSDRASPAVPANLPPSAMPSPPGGTGPSPTLHDDDEVGVFSARRDKLLRMTATGRRAMRTQSSFRDDGDAVPYRRPEALPCRGRDPVPYRGR
jgi:hypothetical protein